MYKWPKGKTNTPSLSAERIDHKHGKAPEPKPRGFLHWRKQMANIIQGTTPTFIFYTEEAIDLTEAEGVWVTFSKTDETEILTKTGDALEITAQQISVYLTQAETLQLPAGKVKAQINITYTADGKEMRAASSKFLIDTYTNLLDEEL